MPQEKLITIAALIKWAEENSSYLTVIWLAIWGGTVRYIQEIHKHDLPFSLLGLVAQWVISGFAGFIAALFLRDSGLSEPLIWATAGIAGCMGSQFITLAEVWVREKFKRRGR